uniref:Ribosomal protein S11 n=1 Tax=Epipogium aphyllum TaxID=449980 RepID=A0A0B4N4U9_9ASPA|nr:ribosomal protein S11 [Epipogium aphyllum]AII40874.1 ribosomal protein S11 [Epipogium aphyllum]AIS35836.1 ribosomal protein S11 [Epipogium aphyllum]
MLKVGIFRIKTSLNNIIITVTDAQGQTIFWSSAGTSGFKGTKKGTPYAAQAVSSNIIQKSLKKKMKRAEIFIKGTGLSRDASLRIFKINGIFFNLVCDVTIISHNGCRPPKKRSI